MIKPGHSTSPIQRRAWRPTPRHRTRVVLQNAATDCGAAALTMVLDGFGLPNQIRDVRESLDAGRDGVTAAAIQLEAADRGLRCRAIRLPRERLDADTLARLPLPAIVHWDDSHFVVLDEVRGRGVMIIDPEVGRLRFDYRELSLHSNGTVLLFERQQRPSDRSQAADPDHGRSSQPSPFSLVLVPLLRANRGGLVALLVASLILSLLGLAVPLAIARLVDTFAAGAGIGCCSARHSS